MHRLYNRSTIDHDVTLPMSKLEVQMPLPVRLMASAKSHPVIAVVLDIAQNGSTPTMILSPKNWKGFYFETMSGAVSFVLGTERDGAREMVYKLDNVSNEVADRVRQLVYVSNITMHTTSWAEVNTLLFLEFQNLVEFRKSSRKGIQLPAPVVPPYRKQHLIKTERKCGIKHVMRVNKHSLYTPDFRKARVEKTMPYTTSHSILGPHTVARPTSRAGHEERSRALRALEVKSPYEVFVTKWLENTGNWTMHMPFDPRSTCTSFARNLLEVDAVVADMKRAWEHATVIQKGEIDCEWLKRSSKKCNSGPDLLEWWVYAFKKCNTNVPLDIRLGILKSAVNRLLKRNAAGKHTGTETDMGYLNNIALLAISTNPLGVIKLLKKYDAELLGNGYSLSVVSQKRWIHLCTDLSSTGQ